MSNTIQLKVNGRQEERVAHAALSPGHLIEVISTGKVQKNATEGAACAPLFAIEDALQGNDVDTAYAAADPVQYVHALPGDEVNALMQAGPAYAVGEKVYSAGDGTLTDEAGLSTTTAPTIPVGIVKTALDLSGSGAVSARTAITIL